MIAAGIGWILDRACGSLRQGRQEEFKRGDEFYEKIARRGFFTAPEKKARWFCGLSQNYCLAAALALDDAGLTQLERENTGVISLSSEGSLRQNTDYFKDFIDSGRKAAHGNLFVRTLPTTPLAQIAMAFGLKGPIVHISNSSPDFNQLIEQAAALSNKNSLSLLCCVGTRENAVISFFLKPGDLQDAYSTENLTKLCGHLRGTEEILRALKVRAGALL